MRRSWPRGHFDSRFQPPAGARRSARVSQVRVAARGGLGALERLDRLRRKPPLPRLARVRITESVARVVAAADLQPAAVTPSQVIAVTRQEFPTEEPYAQSLAEVIGLWPRRPSRWAQPCAPINSPNRRWLPRRHGGMEVRNGGAFLKLEAPRKARERWRDRLRAQPLFAQLIRARVLGRAKQL